MLHAQGGQHTSQSIKGIQATTKFPAQDKITQIPFIDSMKKKFVPRRELLQTLAARHDRSILKGGRFTTMRAIASFAPPE
jgi:hypothetical protein